MKYAIIDMSSSSISLLAAEGEKTFDVILRERETISILHYMEGKNLSERGVEKLAEILNKMKDVCIKTGVEKCYVISTASMRNFENFEWVAQELKKRAAVNVNLLDGEEEAYCDLVSNARYKVLDRAVLIDIGGASIELCDFSRRKAEALTCLDFGPIQLNGKFVKNIHPDEDEAREIRKYVKKKLEKTELPADGAFSTAVLVGVTAQAVYDVYCDYYDEKPEAEKRIEYHKLKKLVKHLVRSSDRSMLVVKNAPERIYTLTTATVILRAMLKYFGVSNIVVSDFGVKEGYLSLITSGKRKGIETDLSELPALSAEAPKKQKSAKKERAENKTEALTEKMSEENGTKMRKNSKKVLAENRTEKKNSGEKGDGEKTAEEMPKKKRGRPRKRPTEGAEVEPRKEV